MSRLLATMLALLLLASPAQLFAKGDTVKITIKGFDLNAPIQITDPQVLARFNVWAGPGTQSTVPGFNPNAPSFIVDWSSRTVSDIPAALTSYEICFYAKLPNERLAYVVYYKYDPSAHRGYIYMPGRDDEFYRLNTSTIYHGIEGQWFHAWSAWDDVAAPLIKASQLSYDPGESHSSACPVTKPNGNPPPGEHASTYFYGNYGNGDLWTTLYPNGTVVFRKGGPGFVLEDGSLSMKFPWWRRVHGKLTIRGKRLDAPAAPLRSDIPDGYGDTGFQATALIFPTEGCWQVTGTAGGASLTFVTRVVRIPENSNGYGLARQKG